MDDPGSRLDLSSDAPLPANRQRASGSVQGEGGTDSHGEFLGIYFSCCSMYARIYRNRQGDAYEGRCPRCFGRVTVGIGPGGSDARFFSAE